MGRKKVRRALETTRKSEQQMLEIYFSQHVYVQTKKINLFLKSAERFREASGEGARSMLIYGL